MNLIDFRRQFDELKETTIEFFAELKKYNWLPAPKNKNKERRRTSNGNWVYRDKGGSTKTAPAKKSAPKKQTSIDKRKGKGYDANGKLASPVKPTNISHATQGRLDKSLNRWE